ncbi:MAG: hypothetical protein ACK4FL_01515 [Microgenomates group bacterium]
MNLYFSEDEEIKIIHEKLKGSLKIWHDFIVEIPIRKNFSFKSKISEIPELNLTEIKENIENLIKIIAKR